MFLIASSKTAWSRITLSATLALAFASAPSLAQSLPAQGPHALAEQGPCTILVMANRHGDPSGVFVTIGPPDHLEFALQQVGHMLVVGGLPMDELWLFDVGGGYRHMPVPITSPDLAIPVYPGWRGRLPPATQAQAERCQGKPVS